MVLLSQHFFFVITVLCNNVYWDDCIWIILSLLCCNIIGEIWTIFFSGVIICWIALTFKNDFILLTSTTGLCDLIGARSVDRSKFTDIGLSSGVDKGGAEGGWSPTPRNTMGAWSETMILPICHGISRHAKTVFLPTTAGSTTYYWFWVKLALITFITTFTIDVDNCTNIGLFLIFVKFCHFLVCNKMPTKTN